VFIRVAPRVVAGGLPSRGLAWCGIWKIATIAGWRGVDSWLVEGDENQRQSNRRFIAFTAGAAIGRDNFPAATAIPPQYQIYDIG